MGRLKFLEKMYNSIRKMMMRKSFSYTVSAMMAISVMMFGLVMVLMSVYGYMVQFHNIDLSYNMALMTNDVNNHLSEKNVSLLDYRLFKDTYSVDGSSAPYTQFYLFSAESLPLMMFMAIVGSLMLGFGLAWNIGLHSHVADKYIKRKGKKK